MKKHLLSSALICCFALNLTSAFAQDKSAHTNHNSNQNAPVSPIVLNQKVGNWDLHCAYPNPNDPNKENNHSQGCIAQQSLMIKNKDNTQTPVSSLLLEKIQDNQKPDQVNPYRLTVVAPLGFSLQEPVALTIDQNNKIVLPWITCTANGCIASQNINDDFQKALEANKTAHLIIHRVNHTTVTINFDIHELHQVLNSMNELSRKKAP